MFGVSGTALVGAIAPAVVGGLLGGGGSKSSETKSTDPRFDPYLYGNDGILNNAANWYANNKTGLNDQMTTGMNNQWAQLQASKPGFDAMQNAGMGLLSGRVAGNPFTGSMPQPGNQMITNSFGGMPLGVQQGGGIAEGGSMPQPNPSIYQPAQFTFNGAPGGAPQFANKPMPQMAVAAPPASTTSPQLDDWTKKIAGGYEDFGG